MKVTCGCHADILISESEIDNESWKTGVKKRLKEGKKSRERHSPDWGVTGRLVFRLKSCRGITGDIPAATFGLAVATPFLPLCPFIWILAFPFCFCLPSSQSTSLSESELDPSLLSPELAAFDLRCFCLLFGVCRPGDLECPFLPWALAFLGVAEEPFWLSIFLDLARGSEEGDSRGRFLVRGLWLVRVGRCAEFNGKTLWPSNSLHTKKVPVDSVWYTTWKIKWQNFLSKIIHLFYFLLYFIREITITNST